MSAGIGTLVGAAAMLPVAPRTMPARSPWTALTRSLDDLTLLAIAAIIPLTWCLRRARGINATHWVARGMERGASIVRQLLDALLVVAPAGVGALAAGLAAGAPRAALSTLAKVIALVWAAQGVMFTVTLLWVAWCGTSLRWLLANARDALLTALVTGSSAATLPVEWRTASQQLGVAPHVAGLVIPAGAVVSKSGTTAFLGALGMAAVRWSGAPATASTVLPCLAGAALLGMVTPPVSGGGLLMLGVLAAAIGADPALAPVLVAIPFVGKLNTPGNVLGRLAIAVTLTPSKHTQATHAPAV
jgi:Na+/H+-dicarboxylate symporter